MTRDERLAELDSWFLSRVPEIPNDRIALRIGELIGRAIHPFEAMPDVREALRQEILTGEHPDIEEIIAKLPPGTNVAVAVIDGDHAFIEHPYDELPGDGSPFPPVIKLREENTEEDRR